MEQCQPLRVLIVGQQNNFTHVLSTNIQHWGHEVMCCSSEALQQKEKRGQTALAMWQADVLLYDLDDVVDAPKSHTFFSVLHILKDRQEFLIALSSRSVSRRTLEQMGAVALLQKPFEMGRLSRYLHVLRQLLHPHVQQQVQKDVEVPHEVMRVLVVDDDVNIAYVIRQCLTTDIETVFDVAIAHDGLDALEQCIHWHPHCIVTDLIMPLMNGYQVMRCLAIGAMHSTPAFVVMSALTQLEAPVDAVYLAGKTVAYVDKPFHIDNLLAAIQQVCLV